VLDGNANVVLIANNIGTSLNSINNFYAKYLVGQTTQMRWLGFCLVLRLGTGVLRFDVFGDGADLVGVLRRLLDRGRTLASSAGILSHRSFGM
jgi:hypothetical protein